MSEENIVKNVAPILVIDDEEVIRTVLKAQLKRLGYPVVCVGNGKQAIQAIQEENFSLIITDLHMPQVDGMTVLRKAKELTPDVPVVVLTAHGSINTAVEAMKLGAFDFLSKPFEKQDLQNIVENALQNQESIHSNFDMIGNSPKMKTVYDLISKVANTPTVVLILGESGTGKELVAKAIHTNSDRKPHPFIQVNCGAIPSELFESELFGHEKGSFTGAITSKPGKFELAEKGTLFLDEIGELPKEMQVKLLRVLQDGSYARVGGIQSKQADVRIVAATNRDLQQEVQQGNFREDLFYRLHVLPIKLPALRDRIEDLPELIRHFIERANKKLHKNVQTTLAINDIQTLQSYHWPGNIRELENLVERAVLLTNNSTITMEDFLHPELRNSPELNLKDYVKSQTARLEKQHIVYILETCNGNVTHAAQKLGISRKSLQNKMREYNLRDNS